jgi:flagella basal body P-ring formation protein FlgA
MTSVTRFLACLLFLASALPALAQVSLRQNITVTGDQIRLGDIFAGLDADIAARPVAPAPAPGSQHRLEAAQLTAIAASNALSWRPATPQTVLIVSRAGHDVSLEQIQSAIANALATRGVVGDGEVSLDRNDLRLTVPQNFPPTVDVADLTYDARTTKFTASLRAPAGIGVITRVTGSFAPMVDVPVAIRPLSAGDVLRESDLSVTRMRADKSLSQIVTDRAKLIGKTTRRTLPAGVPIKAGDLIATVIVTKNHIVNVTIENGPMNLIMQGKALDDGAEGDVVRVLNIRSNKTVQGIVTGPGTVTVLSGASTGGTGN